MDQSAQYRTLIENALTDLKTLIDRPAPWGESDLRAVCAFDEQRGQYILRVLGWSANRRVRATTVHVALQDGKIRVEEDNTEHGIATDLMAAGVPEEDIVLSWREKEPQPNAATVPTGSH